MWYKSLTSVNVTYFCVMDLFLLSLKMAVKLCY